MLNFAHRAHAVSLTMRGALVLHTSWVIVVDIPAYASLGDFNAVGPDYRLTMGAMLDCVRQVTKSDAHFREASADFLCKHGVRAWLDLPVWIPGEGDTAAFHQRSNARAIAAGLTFRSLETTVADTLTAWQHLPDTRKKNLKMGLSAERKSEILTLLAA